MNVSLLTYVSYKLYRVSCPISKIDSLKSLGTKGDAWSQNQSSNDKQAFNTTHKQAIKKNNDEQHTLSKCQEFFKKDPHDRFNLAKSKRVCLNCLSPAHQTHDFQSKFLCKHCKKRHHSLLHYDSQKAEQRICCKKIRIRTLQRFVTIVIKLNLDLMMNRDNPHDCNIIYK